MRFMLILPLALAACATGTRAPSWPDKVHLTGTRMEVSFNDGTLCHAEIEGTFAGTLNDCPYPMSYEVTGYKPSYLATAPGGLGDLFEPYAKVRLTTPTGMSWRFKTPQPIPTKDQGAGQLKLPG